MDQHVDVFQRLSLVVDKRQSENIRQEAARSCNVESNDIEDVYSTTPFQETVLVSSMIRPNTYVECFVLNLTASVDHERLADAWAHVISRNPILRTRIVTFYGRQWQVVLKEKASISNTIVDPDRLNDAIETCATSKLAVPEFGKPLTYLSFLHEDQRANQPTALLWLCHHALYDGYSFRQILTEVAQTYHGLLPKPRLDFAGYVSFLDMVDKDAARTYWTSYLRNLSNEVFPPVQSSSYKPVANRNISEWCPLSLTGQSNAGVAAMVRAGLAMVTSTWTGNSDIVFGAVLASRTTQVEGIRDMTGPTATLLPIRVQLDREQPVSALLQQLHAEAQEMKAFEQGVSKLLPSWGADAQHATGYQTVLVVQPRGGSTIKNDGIGSWTQRAPLSALSSHAMTVKASIFDDGLQLNISFDASVLSPVHAETFKKQLSTVLTDMYTRESDHLVGQVGTVPHSDLTAIWNRNATVPSPANTAVHAIIEATAALHLSKTAVDSWDGQVSYAQLSTLSTKLAEELVDSGLDNEDVVAIATGRSKWTPIVMLAVMKAGGTSLALDMTLPDERLKQIVSRGNPRVTVTSKMYHTRASHIVSNSALIRVDAPIAADTEKLQYEPKLPNVSPQHRLCLLFTSGSTGEPKGIFLSHAGLAASLKYHSKLFQINKESRVYYFAALSFDIAWFDAIQTLAAGACLCIPSEHERMNDLAGSIDRFKATSIFFTPSAAKTLDERSVPSLRAIALGGEPHRAADFKRWSDRVHALSIYGPAECSIVSNALHSPSLEPDFTIGAPYGFNTWLVDPQNPRQLTVDGAVGELVLEGPLVGLGYLNDSAATDASFVRDPPWLVQGTSEHPGRHGYVYRTGDLMRRNQNGSFSFAGRKDGQVKIRGQRVQLGEIEGQIEQLIQQTYGFKVQATAEIVRLAGLEQPQLLVFLYKLEHVPGAIQETNVPNEQRWTSWVGRNADGLDDGLAAVLPKYMIPVAYVPMEGAPILNNNGKVDRKALKAMIQEWTMSQVIALEGRETNVYKSPTSQAEHKLAKLWARVLAIDPEQISTSHNFLKLGGDSTSAMQLVGLAREAGCALTVADVLRHPRLHDQARLLKDVEQSEEAGEPLPFALLELTGVAHEPIRSEAALACNVNPYQIEDVLPCTPLQAGLLSLALKQPGDYIATMVLKLHADASIVRVKLAWEQTLSTTPILRTRIIELEGQGLVQVVVSDGTDWNIESGHNQTAGLQVGLGAPLCLYSLLSEKESSDATSLVLAMHHAVYDAWSVSLVMDRFKAFYYGRSCPPSQPFSHFVRHVLDNASNQAVQRFWEGQFQGLEAQGFPELPSPAHQPRADACVVRCEARPTWSSTKVTEATGIRAAWALLQARYTNESEVLFGATVNGRHTPLSGIEMIIGPTISTIPLRVKLDLDHTVAQLLDGVNAQARDMEPFEQSSLSQIRRINDDTCRACSFQTLLLIQSGAVEHLSQQGLFASVTFREHSNDRDRAGAFNSYALMIEVTLLGSEIQIQFSFDSSVLDHETVVRMGQQFAQVLQEIYRHVDTDLPLRHLNMLTDRDLTDIRQWNPALHVHLEDCVHDIIAKTVARQPDSIAVDAWDGQLTYRGLDLLSSQLAQRAIADGVGPGTIVPLALGKSMWMSVAVLAVMKSGAACLMLDVNQPIARLQSIITQIKHVPLVMYSTACRDMAKQLNGRILLADREDAQDGLERPLTPLPQVRASDPLYVVFTSGSTGLPKGAVITHENFASAISASESRLLINKTSRVLDFASYSFDVAWSNAIHTWAAGGCLCVPSEMERDILDGTIAKYRATWVELTPTVAKLLDPRTVPSLSVLNLSGEKVRIEDFTGWTSSQVQLLNTYGPAECTVTTTAAKIGCAGEEGIGRGINTNTWIVDDLGLCPIGAVGELVLEGPLVGAGYLNDEAKTAASFMNEAWWHTQLTPSPQTTRKTRFYKTGDLVRYTQAGNLQFIGRKDAQVKLRGQRIELNEIEHHVRETIQELHGTELGRAVQVVAEVVTLKHAPRASLAVFMKLLHEVFPPREELDTNLLPMVPAIHNRLKDLLPVYLLPSFYVPCQRLGTTVAGKADRRQLREMAAQWSSQDAAKFSPHTSIKREAATLPEQQMIDIWAQVLNLKSADVSADDHFFHLGGDSIDIMRVVSIVRQRKLGFFISAKDVFAHPRLSDLVFTTLQTNETDEALNNVAPAPFSLIPEISQVDNRSEVALLCGPDVTADDVEDVLPCTPLQEAVLAMTARREGAYVTDFTRLMRSEVDIDRFERAWQSVVSKHSILRTRIVDLTGQGLVQVVLKNVSTLIRSASVGDRERLKSDVDMGLGTALNMSIIFTDPNTGKTYFTWRSHHAVYDGRSLQKMTECVLQEYLANDSSNDALQTDVAPFSAFVRYVAEQDQARATDFWTSQFEDISAIPFPPLPRHDYNPRPDGVVRRNVDFANERRAKVPISTAIRAALAVVLARYTDKDEALFGEVLYGRQATLPGVALEDLIGPTIAVVPVRVALGNDTFVTSLQDKLQQQSSDRIPYEQTGIQNIRRLNTDTEQACNFQTLLTITPEVDTKTDALFDRDDATNGENVEGFGTYALMVDCITSSDSMTLQLVFDSGIIHSHKVERMASQLESVFQQIRSCDETTLVRDVRTLVDEDIQDIWAWNKHIPDTSLELVHDLISKAVLRQPTKCAISAWDGELTFVELEDMTNIMAQCLQSNGVTVGTVVPLLFEKSMWMPVAALATMKAGGCSVALDVEQPFDRLRHIVTQATSSLLVCSRENQDLGKRLAMAKDGQRAFVLDALTVEEALRTTRFTTKPLLTESLTSSSTLYIVYTSGSTGTPKGVVISHGNFSSSIAAGQQVTLLITSETRIFDFASYAFDVSWSNMLHALTAGACLCIPSEDDRRGALSESINKTRANWIELSPAVAKQLLDPVKLPYLRVLNLSGEAVQPDDFQHWTTASKEVLITYGPSECTITTTCADLRSNSKDLGIGHTTGAVAWIVSQHTGELAPIGAVGELWLEGPLVGSGYFNDPVNTQSSFIADPVWLRHHPIAEDRRMARFYKTGDMVRYSHDNDGALVFVGRKDNQVKLRGQRVELADIEHHIRQTMPAETPQPPVSMTSAIVQVVRTTDTDRDVLVAFIQLALDQQTGGEDDYIGACKPWLEMIEIRMSSQLPSYMVPSVWIPMRLMPTGLTGKVDRKALASLAHTYMLSVRNEVWSPEHKSPQTPREQELLELWSTILGRRNLGTESHFFRSGGDSIDAMRLVSQARQRGLYFSSADVFTYPTLAELAVHVQTTGPSVSRKVQPFALLPSDIDIREIQDEAAATCGTNPSQIEDILPVTSLQAGMLFLTTQRPGQYVARFHYPLHEDVDVERLGQAWNTTVAALPILRTRFVQTRAGLVQVVLSKATAGLEYMDITKHAVQFGRPFSCATFTTSAETGRSQFTWNVHHALYDGWSLSLVFDALARAYHQQVVPDPTPFGSFLVYSKDASEQATNAFWKESLRGCTAPSFPPLPTPEHEPRPTEVHSQTIHDLPTSRPGGVTMSNVVRAAWAILAARMNDSQEAVFGAVVSGRQTPVVGIENVVAPTMATVPVRIGVNPTMLLEGFLQAIQKQANDMVPFEQTSLTKIRQMSQDAERSCKFQTLLAVQPATQRSGSDLISTIFEAEADDGMTGFEEFGSYALTIQCFPNARGDQLRLSMLFDPMIIDTDQVKRLSLQFELILRQLCQLESPNKRIEEIDLLGEHDINEIWKWNGNDIPAVDACIHDLIASQVRARPTAEAICAWDGSVTYLELHELSSKVAVQLLELNIRQGDLIPLLFEKSKWTAIAMLAVIKAGGTAAAMDITQNHDRLHSNLKQLSPRFIMASENQAALATSLSEDITNARVQIVSARSLHDITDHATDVVWPKIEPSANVCCVFTSGSTGNPKGVLLTHRNFATALTLHTKLFKIDASSRVFDFVSYSFDFAWSNFIMALMTGACLCVPSDSERQNDIAGSLRKYRATFACFTPALARTFQPDTLHEVRTLVVGGEAVRRRDLPIFDNGCEVWLVYGPSECTVLATMKIPSEDDDLAYSIGRGMAMNTWVADETELTPIGAVGELWLEGPLVGPGYLRDTERTNAAFVSSPPWLTRGSQTHPGREGRVYRTGDLVRYGQKGEIIFVGRKDTQAKLRGQRVELGEVEFHTQAAFLEVLAEDSLPQCAAASRSVLQVVCEIVTFESSDIKTLAAFVSLRNVPSSEQTEQHDEIVRRLAQGIDERFDTRLPKHMIPTAIIPMAQIITTTTGKADRRRLREHAKTLPLHRTINPQAVVCQKQTRQLTEVEQRLSGVWKKVLNLQIDVHADAEFTRVGGDSITAMQVASAARALGMPVTVQQLMQRKTLSQIAAVCEVQQVTGPTHSLSDEVKEVNFPLSPIQQFFTDDHPEANICFDICFFLKLNRDVSTVWLREAFETIIARHAMLRARFTELAPGKWEQRITDAVAESLLVMETLDYNDDQLSAAFRHARDSIDIENGPLTAFVHVKDSSGQQRLFLTINHLVSDFMSFRVIFQDLEDLLAKKESRPILSMNFQQWAFQQKQAARYIGPQEALPFVPQPACWEYWGLRREVIGREWYRRKSFVLDQKTTTAIHGQCNNTFESESLDLMLATLLYAFSRTFPDRQPPPIYTEGHGREGMDPSLDVTQTVGWFTTMYPVQLEGDDFANLRQCISRTVSARRNVPCKGWSYFSSKYLNEEGRKAFHSSGMEVNFNYLGAFQQLEMEGTSLSRLAVPDGTAPESNAKVRGFSVFEISAVTRQGELQFEFLWDHRAARSELIERWVDQTERSLGELAGVGGGMVQ